ncbi:hypothetical protein Tco_0448394 [Tanacetum coccineum]
MTRVDSLEKDLKQTKLTMGSAIVKLVKKVKKLEGLVTPSKPTVNASGEEQVEDISPTTLKAAKTLSKVASQKPKSIDKGRKYKRRKETKGKKRESSLAKAIRLDTLEKEEEAKQSKIEANAELSKSVLGSGLQGEDFAKKMVELVNQRKKHFAEERARAKRNKPWTPITVENYMMNYLMNQLYKDSLKRFGEELQTKTSKRLKSDEAKDDESTKKTGKRRKQIARKGLHSDS